MLKVVSAPTPPTLGTHPPLELLMARALVLNLEGEISELPLARIDRAKLYGAKRRLVTDEDGQPCRSAWLSTDGATLVPSGGYTLAYVDAAGSAIPRDELVAIDADGEVLDQLPSTLGVEHELFGPVPTSRVLDHVTTSVYHLDATGIGATLATRLDRGEIFEAEFRYMTSVTTNALFLLRNESGTFALVCQPVDLAFLQPDAPADLDEEDSDDADGDSDDELDFNF